jgi:Protein of unknown function (DUF1588)/Protein of unknown function (DUF1592)/Protein of unknown function (DUF1595)/Protein of unknown function (DUF1585)/Protein of unknown function (DUF1587)
MTRIGLMLLLLTLAACEGVITSPPREAAPATPGKVVEACASVNERALLPARVRRLQAGEYRNTLAALTNTTPALEFPTDPAPNGYGTRADALRVNAPLVELLWRETPALAATTTQALLASPPCRPADGEACARTILSSFGARAYRRPLSDDELGDLLEVFGVGATGADFASGLGLALEVVFQSSSMLFHTELGAGGLTPHETAELLSYLLTGAPPDAELRALADLGPIGGAAREAQAQRLLATPAARVVLGDFAAQWLHVDQLASTVKQAFPQWATLRSSALDETRTFVATAVLEGEPLRTLFTADWTTTSDPTLAAHYGATALAPGRWTLPAARAGVLSHASVMAKLALGSESAPVQRGRLVRTRLMCQFKRFAPPADLKITLPPLDANATTRERFAAHSSNATCQGCHRYLDPIGFGFEHFDAIGGYREVENGKPIDASGALIETDADGTFTGVRGLGELLASSAQARDCFAQNWFEYSMGQPLDEVGLPALCSLRDVTRSFTSSEQPMKSALLEIIRSDLFTARTP